MRRPVLSALPVLLVAASSVLAQKLPPADAAPQLRVEAGGPTSMVTAMAFSPDGKRLFVAGLDKVVRVWERDNAGKYQLDKTTYRIPIGPGVNGGINALAVSPDGKWVAVGGHGVFRGQAGFREGGFIWPVQGAVTTEMYEDRGLIYVFSTTDQTVKILRGHRGTILALAFAQGGKDHPAVLASAGIDRSKGDTDFEGSVRAWDVDKESMLGSIGSLPKQEIRVGLSAWSYGAAARQVRVAIAWNDGELRFWDVDTDQVRPATDGNQNVTAAYRVGAGRLVTARPGTDGVGLHNWKDDDGKPVLEKESRLRETANTFPRALAVIPGASDRLAAIAQVRRGEEIDYRLYVLDADGTARGDLLLWSGQARQPALAVDPTGKYLAAAGHQSQSIHILELARFTDREGAQIIVSDGARFRSLAFVKKGEDRGLLLSPAPTKTFGELPSAAAKEDVIFDFTQRQLAPEHKGWDVEAAERGAWSVKTTVQDKVRTLTVYEDERKACAISFSSNFELSDYTFLARQPTVNMPLLAVATHNRGEPRLVLYNAHTGEPLRYLTGHVERIQALAFSPDGLTLASVAQDQTVCVWPLKNLDRVVNKYGQLSGVTVTRQDNAVAIARVEADSPHRDRLRPKDIVKGIVTPNGLREFAMPGDFYWKIAPTAPKEKVTLRIVRDGEERDIELTVNQAIDERKPLFTLFVTRGGERKAREWIGWSPLGPYESSGQPADRLLGWHSNTGDEAKPTAFALAGQYRAQNYREGVLKELLIGEPKIPDPPRPRPSMTLTFPDPTGEAQRPGAGGLVTVRKPEVILRVEVRDRPLSKLKELSWTLQGKEKQVFDKVLYDGDDAVAEIRLTPRDEKTVRVTAVDDTAVYSSDRAIVRYVPPKPAITWESPAPGKRPEVRAPKYKVRAKIAPQAAGEVVVAQILQKGKDKAVAEKEFTEPGVLEAEINLQPGDNLIQVSARNKGAVSDTLKEETAEAEARVYFRMQQPAPVVKLNRVIPISPLEPVGAPREIKQNGAIAIESPRVRIEGTITSNAHIALATWTGGGEPQAIRGFKEGEKELKIEQEVELKPGTQDIQFTAKSADSDPGSDSVRIAYSPRLPVLADLKPAGQSKRIVGLEPREVDITAALRPTDNKHDFQAKIQLNGKDVSAPVTIDKDNGTLKARVTLERPDNDIRVRLENKWSAVEVYGDASIRYVSTPQLDRWDVMQKIETLPQSATVYFKSDLPLSSVEARVNDTAIAKDAIELIDPPTDRPQLRGVKIKNLPLTLGKNSLKVLVANREDSSGWIERTGIEYDPPAPPTVDILAPTDDVALNVPDGALRFRVRSKDPLQKLEVIRDGTPEWRRAVDPATMKREGQSFTADEIRVPLNEGVNVVHVSAWSKGGRGSAKVMFNYVPPPVRVAGLEIDGVGKAELKDGKLFFKTAEAGRVKLRGKVIMPKDDPRLTRREYVRVYVNGFQQLPANLTEPAAGKNERTFEASILLNQKEGNQIEVMLPDLPKEATQTSAWLDCDTPARAQRLHLLIISVQDVNAAKLQQEFLTAFKASPASEQFASLPTFEKVFTPRALVGPDARPQFIRRELADLRTRIKALAATAGAKTNDVVVFYFKGGEAIDKDGHVFRTAGEAASGALTLDWIVGQFSDTPGAHVLFFDVERQGTLTAERDAVRSGAITNNIAFLRYAREGAPDPFRATLPTALGGKPPLDNVIQQLREKLKPRFDTRIPDSNLGSAPIGVGLSP